MKLKSETSDRLVLEDRPWALGIGITIAALASLAWALAGLFGAGGGAGFGLFAFLMCLSAFAAFVRLQEVTLDRAAGRVSLQVTSVFGRKSSAIALADVTGVVIETRPGRRRGGRRASPTHRVVLRRADGGSFPLSEVHVSGPGASELAGKLARWLGLPGPST